MFGEKPRIITAHNMKIPIDPDFRIMCEFSHGALTGDRDLQCRAVSSFYYAGLPEGIDEKTAVEEMRNFYLDGLSPNREGKAKKENADSTPEPSFDFKEDEGYFYAAFLEHYGINLNTSRLHWFDFCALFRGLPDECKLKRIIDIRAVKLSEIRSGAEKAQYRKLKGVFALKIGRQKKFATASERDNAMRAELEKRMDEIRRAVEKENEL